MSGTSADGIDAVLVNFEDHIRIIDTKFHAYPKSIRSRIQRLQLNSDLGYHELATLDIELGLIAAKLVNDLITTNSGIEVTAIGSHGQTVQHKPNDFPAYTLQIGSGATIVENCGITTVNDFRSRDVALGGQGAPFAPLFHQAFFASNQQNRVILNIGGIANISYLEANENVIGFDTGPGNTLIDLICRSEFNQDYDEQGKLAQTGAVSVDLLNQLKSDSYFTLSPPKSTGQEYFNEMWLTNHLDKYNQKIKPIDVLATITQLTADSIAQSISQFCPNTDAIYLCGGGTHNQTLLNLLKQNIDCDIQTTEYLGIHPDWVEACGFAWLAKQAVDRNPVNLTKITGTSRPCVLGSIWPVIS